jgi:hypothetical protein
MEVVATEAEEAVTQVEEGSAEGEALKSAREDEEAPRPEDVAIL